MDEVKVIEIKKSIFDENNKDADNLRSDLKKRKIFLLNVMSSPGSGKTTTLIKVINALKKKFKIAVMEADIDSKVDAEKIKVATGVQTIQLHTGGMCHLDAEMTKQGLDNLDMNQVDLVIVTSPYASLETAFTFFSFSNACLAEVSISLILLSWLTSDAPGS